MGLLATILITPVLAAIALVVRATSGGPAIHRATRMGRDGHTFTCYKFRTMCWSPERPGDGITSRSDTRVTPIGRVLRRHRLDELPQLWNVARGEMLLVGPRPEDPRFVDMSKPLHRLVFGATPGITGLTQLAFADESAMLDANDPERQYREVILPQKLAIDADYLRRRSTALDLWILGQTVLTAMGRRTPAAAIEARR
jgi:lipopolysaccharide/colanic/teichoic acid biosynthesis glycosyltransferase